MTEKRYILESPADLIAARSAMRAGGLIRNGDIEIAISALVDRFLAPIPKIFTDKFEWMTQCATFAKAALEFIPAPDAEEFFTTATESDEGAPGARKVTTYDAPDAPRVSKTRIAAGTISNAIIEVGDKRAAEIRKAFKPMILPIWDGGEE